MRNLAVVLAAATFATSSLVGCGGSKNEEPSLVQQVDVVALEQDPEIRARKLLDIARQQEAMKDRPGAAATMTKALAAAKEIKEQGARADVVLDIAKELMKTGGSKIQADAAIDIAQVAVATIADRAEKVRATVSLGEALFQLGEKPLSDTTLNSAQSLVEGVADAEKRAPLLAALFAARSGTGEPAKAAVALQSALAAAQSVGEVRARVRAESQAAAVLYGYNRVNEGRKFVDAAVADAKGIEDPQRRGYALSEIIEALNPYRTQLPLGDLMTEAANAARAIKDIDQQSVLMRHLQTLQNTP